MHFENKNPYIFLICGNAKSGKDIVASFIKEYFEEKNKKTINLQYTTYIKKYTKNIIGWDGKEETKPREFLNHLGVELIKMQIDPAFTVRRTIEDVKVYSYFYDCITVSDVRFVEEVEVPKKTFKKVFSIHVESPTSMQALSESAKEHSTAHGFDHYDHFDYTIVNDRDLDTLKEKVETILKEVEINEH
ncbi:MAG: hypothetical protein PHN72_03250 [Bacilli bacterium]|nr:hypothetical protein [Bacilli bacterium]